MISSLRLKENNIINIARIHLFYSSNEETPNLVILLRIFAYNKKQVRDLDLQYNEVLSINEQNIPEFQIQTLYFRAAECMNINYYFKLITEEVLHYVNYDSLFF